MPHRPLWRAIGGGPLLTFPPVGSSSRFCSAALGKPTWNIFWLGSRSSPTRPAALACILCQTSQPKQPKQPGKGHGGAAVVHPETRECSGELQLEQRTKGLLLPDPFSFFRFQGFSAFLWSTAASPDGVCHGSGLNSRVRRFVWRILRFLVPDPKIMCTYMHRMGHNGAVFARACQAVGAHGVSVVLVEIESCLSSVQ